MTKLSDTQAILLAAAAQRKDGNVLPLPGSLRGGAATKVVGALLARGLIREEVSDSLTKADAALNTIWRNADDGRAVLLHIAPAGLEAIGVGRETTGATEATSERPGHEPASGPTGGSTAATAADGAREPAPPQESPAARSGAQAGKVREGTKQAALIAMLKRAEGATIPEIVAATGWQPHTVRGAFAGALKKRLGLAVTSAKVEGRGRVYGIED